MQVPHIDRRGFLNATLASLMCGGTSTKVFGAEPNPEFLPIEKRMAALEKAAPLAMQFHRRTAEDARRWQSQFSEKLCELLGPFRPPVKWECVLENRVERDTHVREERVLTAPGVDPLPFHLLLPVDRDGATKRAGILALHGHGDFGHDSIAGIDDTPERRAEIERFQYDYGRKLVERGYVVVAPCFTPFGRRLQSAKVKRSDACDIVNLQLQHLGRLLIADNLRDALWTLEYLAQHESVDADRLGCVGLSLGGRMATLTAALEPRVKVAVLAGAMNCLQERAMHGSVAGCQTIPGLLQYGDIPEIAALIAPRPCLWQVGATDKLLDPAWTEKVFQRQSPVYAALDAADQLSVDRFAGGHMWHGETAYPLLDAVLRS